MLSPIKAIIISSALINPIDTSKPIVLSGDYTIEANEYLRKVRVPSTQKEIIIDIMYQEILQELREESKVKYWMP